MRPLLALLLIALIAACDAAPPGERASGAADRTAPAGAPAELPAADPVVPSLEAFTAEATAACVAAVAALEAVPLRGDPLTSYAKPRDVRAAVRHHRVAARAWSHAADALFAFGTPEDARGQRFIAALDVLAMRARRVAQALANGDIDDTQAMLAAAEQALDEADAAGRELGIGPLLRCGTPVVKAGGRRRAVVNAVDFSFRPIGGAIPQGPARLVLRNRGTEDHQLFVVPLRQAGSLAAAVAADRRGERLAGFLSGPGAATAVARPGERVTVDVKLRPGPYGFLCYVASPDGTPHAYKGMALEVMVQG